MMEKPKKFLTNWRILMLLFFIVASLVAINPHPWREGLAIRSVDLNSSAYLAGMQPPKPADQPVERERILSVNNIPVFTLEDYQKATSNFAINQTVYVKTNKQTYRLKAKEAFETVYLNGTRRITVEELIVVNESVNGTLQPVARLINVTKDVQKTKQVSLGTEDVGLHVYPAPQSNLKKGLDLHGGTRVLLQPEALLAQDAMGSLIDTMTQRLNVYGLSDIVVREAGDLSGNQYILVEVAGAT